MGPILGAEFLVAAGDLSAFDGADKLAAYAEAGTRRQRLRQADGKLP
jgi:hypothetical protein